MTEQKREDEGYKIIGIEDESELGQSPREGIEEEGGAFGYNKIDVDALSSNH